MVRSQNNSANVVGRDIQAAFFRIPRIPRKPRTPKTKPDTQPELDKPAPRPPFPPYVIPDNRPRRPKLDTWFCPSASPSRVMTAQRAAQFACAFAAAVAELSRFDKDKFDPRPYWFEDMPLHRARIRKLLVLRIERLRLQFEGGRWYLDQTSGSITPNEPRPTRTGRFTPNPTPGITQRERT